MSGPECGLGRGTTEGGQRCPTCCSSMAPQSRLRRLQINNEECVSVCSDEKCLSNPSSSSLILRRKSSEIPNIRRRRARHSAPAQEILAPPSFRRILLWRNKDALCWLDASLLLMVFCRSLRRCLDASSNEADSLKALCREFDNAQVTFQAANPERTEPSGDESFRQSEVPPGPGSGVVGPMTEDSSPCGISVDIESSAAAGIEATSVASLEDSSELMQLLDEDTSVVNVREDRETARIVEPTTPSLSADSTPYLVGGRALGEGAVTGRESCRVEEPLALLDGVRERLWVEVQPKLGCQRGGEDSPVFALPVILRKNRNLEAHFRTLYHWQFSCSSCSYVEVTPCKSVMPSLKTLNKSLNVTSYLSHRPCPSCQAPAQRNRLFIRSLPPCPMFHFIDGLPELGSWSQLDFHHDGHDYRVASLVQYKQNPNHFVGWVKDTERDLWLQGDDLKGPVVHWSRKEPDLPAAQCHVVMWERQGSECSDCNSLQNVVRGILEAEHLDLAPPSSVSRSPESEVWTGEGTEGQEGLTPPCLEGYIPKGLTTAGSRAVTHSETDKDVTAMMSNSKVTNDGTAGNPGPLSDRLPGRAGTGGVAETSQGTRSQTQSSKVRVDNYRAQTISEDIASSLLSGNSTADNVIVVNDQCASLVGCDRSPGVECTREGADVAMDGICGRVPGSLESKDSRSPSPSGIFHSIEQSRVKMDFILSSVKAMNKDGEEDAGVGKSCSAPTGQSGDPLGNPDPAEKPENSEPSTTESVRSEVPLGSASPDGILRSLNEGVRKRRVRVQREGGTGLSRSASPTAAVTRSSSRTTVPVATSASNESDASREYKRKLNALSRVTEWSDNELEGPLRRDLEKRARLGRLADAKPPAERPGQASSRRVGRAADVELVYTGRSAPGRILSSIPSQLDSVPTNGRRNSLETWRMSRGKPTNVGSSRGPSRQSTRVPSLRSSSSQAGERRKPVTRAAGLAAKFASFCQSLPTFSQYKETVEGSRQVGNPVDPPPSRNRRAGSLSPMGSPSGSSESSDNSRLALSAFPGEFMDVTPMASPAQFLPDLEKFFNGFGE